MQNADQNDILSWFQVAGIHGYPFIAYDGANGVNGFQANPANQAAGYCTHGSTLFPTWHRPYTMLVEVGLFSLLWHQHVMTVLFFLFFFFLQQIINQHAQQIAATYTTSDKAQWVDAALKLRLAYWDWAENSVPPPQVISLDQVEITMPSGQRSNVTNPLRGYRFHPMPSDMSRPYRNWPRTLRQPTGPRSDATDDVPLLIK